MKLRTFTGQTMAEALRQVRACFGERGVIVSTRTVTKRGLPGIKAKTLVEMTAAAAMDDLPAELRTASIPLSGDGSSAVEGATSNVTAEGTGAAAARFATLPKPPHPLRSTPFLPPHFSGPSAQDAGIMNDSIVALARQRVGEDLTRALVERIRRELPAPARADRRAVRGKLREFIASMLPTAGPIRPAHPDRSTTVALVGPAGAGKTTTIAKLAAHLALHEGLRVGLVTLDLVRVGAVEQLRLYAEVLGVPMESAATPADLALSLRRLGDRQIILVDTPGCAARDAARLVELKACLDRAAADQVHLVLPASGDERVLRDALQRFGVLGVRRVIFTRLDEALGFGVILNVLQDAGAALSYVTAGPKVPDDIHLGEGNALAGMILADDALEPARSA